jgi:nitrilase
VTVRRRRASKTRSAVTVAVVQAAAVGFDAEKSIRKTQTLSAAAAKRGADVVVFPEAFISGYPKGLDFGARVGRRTAQGRDDFRRYWDSAIEVPGPACARLCAIARANKIYLVVGVIERSLGTLYCCALFFSPAGRLMGKHRKLMPTASERLIWGFGDGSTMPVFDTPFGRLGAIICWENYMPLLRAAMFAKGITLYCAPTADDRDTWLPTMRHIALEGRCFVLSACQCTRRRDYPADYPIDGEVAPDDVLMRGGSCIVGPLGEVLAAPVFDREAIITAELDLNEVPRSRLDFDAVGHYARPDIFSLAVDERAQTPVRFAGADNVSKGGQK